MLQVEPKMPAETRGRLRKTKVWKWPPAGRIYPKRNPAQTTWAYRYLLLLPLVYIIFLIIFIWCLWIAGDASAKFRVFLFLFLLPTQCRTFRFKFAYSCLLLVFSSSKCEKISFSRSFLPDTSARFLIICFPVLLLLLVSFLNFLLFGSLKTFGRVLVCWERYNLGIARC